jgi:hypothetical protein
MDSDANNIRNTSGAEKPYSILSLTFYNTICFISIVLLCDIYLILYYIFWVNDAFIDYL